MNRSLMIDTVEASAFLLFRYQWLSTLLQTHTCSFVTQVSQPNDAAPLPRVLLAMPAFHWKGKTQGRLQAIKKLVDSDSTVVWVSHQQNWQLPAPYSSIWTAETSPSKPLQVSLPVSPWSEPPEWEYLAAICDAEAGGQAYFFCMADRLSEAQLIQLLKAFSLFKKWQQSSLQLLISWTQMPQYWASLNQQIETYKYRKDLHLKWDLDPNRQAQLILGAYAFLYFGEALNRDWILTAATLDVPVIAAPVGGLNAYFEETIIWVSASEWEKLGQQLIRLYKDESYRNEFIRGAGERARPWTHAEIDRCWQEELKN